MRVDLNLLVSLNALLEERSVTRAAQRLGLSQPTLSTALNRLRAHYADALLVRDGRTYRLSPLGEELLESTRQALSWTERVFDTHSVFDPGHVQREFVMVASDSQLPVLGAAMLRIIAAEAPGVRLRFEHSTARLVQPGIDWLRGVDLFGLPQGLIADAPSLDLYRDRWVCLVDASRPVGPLTLEEAVERPWVMPYHARMPVLSALHRLRQGGVDPRATVSTENFLAVPHLVAGSDRIGLVPARVAALAARSGEVSVIDPPFALGMLVEALWWHPIHERDAGHRWLRRVAVRAAHELEREPGVAPTP